MSFAALLRPEPIPVTIGGARYTVRPADAAEWLIALTGSLHESVIPAMLDDDDQADLIGRLMAGEVSSRAVWDAACQVIEVVSGRRWWQALYLAGYAEGQNGLLFGRMLLAGVHPAGLTFAAWGGALFALITEHMDETQRMKFDASFSMPPDGDVSQVDDWDTGIPEGWA